MTQIATDIGASLRHAALDEAYVGDIRGTLGTITHHDTGVRDGWHARLRMLLATLSLGLIVTVDDNNAGAFGTYTRAGQNYGTTLLWTLMLLIPALYVNQEMVLRLGAVVRVGHTRLIFARFGKSWGSFSVIDLFLVNALTLVTEFIGVSLALEYLGIPRHWGACAAAALVMLAAFTGDFRRFECFTLALVAGSLTLIPVFLLVHPPMGQAARDFFVSALPAGTPLAEVMLLVIAIVGTTVALWQLLFQQSYMTDKRITARFIRYERADLWLGIVLVIAGAVAMIAFSVQAFHSTPESGNYTDVLGTTHGLECHSGRWAGVLFAVALLDASIIDACAVPLSTVYAIGDVFAVRHSLYRRPTESKGFYAIYFEPTLLAAGLVLTPGVPLGLLTNAMQSLAGVLLPSATVFLLLLCNDRAVLGPWTNGRAINLFIGAVMAVLVMLSVILTAAILFPGIDKLEIGTILIGDSFIAVVMSLALWRIERRRHRPHHPQCMSVLDRNHWTIPPLEQFTPARWTPLKHMWTFMLRSYLVVAAGLVLVRIVGLLAQ